jgi:PKD repeat protein
MKTTNTILPGLAIIAAAILLAPPEEVLAFKTTGGILSAETQRDFRVHNSFADLAANDNTTIDPNWPGWDGAELALWKATSEWGSGLFGDGSGDPLQPTIGDGRANFDAYFAGHAASLGGSNDNVFSAITSCASGVIAYIEGPVSNGWAIRFCDSGRTFSDGPGQSVTGHMDIQGIATHEFGHALGLGHSTDSTSTMWSSTTPLGSNDLRSIESDDRNGVQFIYGGKSASKPTITAVSRVGATITLIGSNFSSTGNEIWFTQDLPTVAASDPHLKVLGVTSTDGGTRIVVTAPAESGSGVVMVKRNATGFASLSNAYPIDLPEAPDPLAAFVATPLTGNAPLSVAFTDHSTGTGPFTYGWDFGDGGTSAATNPVHSYGVPGTYTVSLRIDGAQGWDSEIKTGYITVTGGILAKATSRNGSEVNPRVFTSTSLPILGTSWTSVVNAGALGLGGLVFHIVYTGPHSGIPIAAGELLLDPTSTWLGTASAMVIGGLASYSIAIPIDPIYAGSRAFCQAYVPGAAPAGQLTNGIDLLLGY